jgi:hypothetical protein
MDDDDDDDNDGNNPVWPTWAVGALFRGARRIHICVCEDVCSFIWSFIYTSQRVDVVFTTVYESISNLLKSFGLCMPRRYASFTIIMHLLCMPKSLMQVKLFNEFFNGLVD